MTMAAAGCLLHPNPISNAVGSSSSSRNRVECCATSSNSASASSFPSRNSGGSRLSCSATRLLFPPQISIPAFEVPEADDDLEELTILDHGNNDDAKRSSTWLTPQYLNLRLRCSSLIKREASDALSRHFKNKQPVAQKFQSKPFFRAPNIKKKPVQHQQQLHLISESYQGPVEFIRDVVIHDIQEEYFKL